MNESDTVCFALDDYASIPRRLIAFFIDLFVIVLILYIIYAVMAFVVLPKGVYAMPRSPEKTQVINTHMRAHIRTLGLTWLGLICAYHILIRATGGGTVGYRLARIRLVDLTGRVPTLKTLLRRFLVAVPGCLLFGVTYLNCRRSPRRQAGHDQWCGTWLVRKRAESAGPGLPVFQTRLIGTFLLTFPDVEPVSEEAGASPSKMDANL
ncbi:MAG: RDD family protein [Phycisphaerae bacterium]